MLRSSAGYCLVAHLETVSLREANLEGSPVCIPKEERNETQEAQLACGWPGGGVTAGQRLLHTDAAACA